MTECTKCGRTLPPPYKQVLAEGEKIICATCAPSSAFRIDEMEYPPADVIMDHTSTKDDWRDYFFGLGVDYQPSEQTEDSNEGSEDPEAESVALNYEKHEKAIRYSVLLAYYFGRRYENANRHDDVKRTVEPAIKQLQGDGNPKSLIRTAFYFTVLAETYRFHDSTEYRRNLLTVSLKIERLGLKMPFELYKAILEATTTINKSSYFGSHVVQAHDHNPVLLPAVSLTLLDLPSYDTAARAVGLTLEEYQEFISKCGRLSLREIMVHHGLVHG